MNTWYSFLPSTRLMAARHSGLLRLLLVWNSSTSVIRNFSLIIAGQSVWLWATDTTTWCSPLMLANSKASSGNIWTWCYILASFLQKEVKYSTQQENRPRNARQHHHYSFSEACSSEFLLLRNRSTFWETYLFAFLTRVERIDTTVVSLVLFIWHNERERTPGLSYVKISRIT